MKLLQLCEPGQTPLPHEERKNKENEGLAVGIDLGTTHSLIAFSVQGSPRVFKGEQEKPLVPSAIAIDEKGNKKVGEEALLCNPQHIIRSAKRLMGKSLQDVQMSSMARAYPLDPDNDKGMVGLKVNGVRITPIEVGMCILDFLKKRAEKFLNLPINKAVITVPAYFDDAARKATQEAASLSGIKVLRLINEPTAAALAYGLDQGLEGLYIVYDFGGGTFDVSLLSLEKEVFRVIATGGNTQLGGDDIDQSIVQHWLEKNGLKNPSTRLYQQLLFFAKKAKEYLSSNKKFIENFKSGENKFTLHLTLKDLEKIVDPIVQKTLNCCTQVLEDKQKSIQDLKGVVLVGGTTKMPCVQEKVATYFKKEPLCTIDPEKVVAYGAALQAEALTTGANHLLLDVLPLSLGIETMGGLTEKIIDRNTPIPAVKRQEFTTYQDGQSGMLIHVVQGEREKVEDCRSLASFSLKGIPPQVAGQARIEVTFQVDADGLLTVRAQEKKTGIHQEVQVKATYGLHKKDAERLVREGFYHAKEDMAKRQIIQEQVEAQRILQALEKALEKEGSLLAPLERKLIDQQKNVCKKLCSSTDYQTLKKEMEKLEQVTENFAKMRMNQAIQASFSGKKI